MAASLETSGRIFRNRNFKHRNYECSNVVYCIAGEKPTTPDDRWVEVDAMPYIYDLIYAENGVRYYGYL